MKYICIVGIDGTGKSTQIEILHKHFIDTCKLKVLKTREPGTPLIPFTMELRSYMLSNDYKQDMTKNARELISQAIRSIHMEKLIYPALQPSADSKHDYDIILQDRCAFDGFAYAMGYGHGFEWLQTLNEKVMQGKVLNEVYDHIIFFETNNVELCLQRAKTAKSEYTNGDVVEGEGVEFMKQVQQHMKHALNVLMNKEKVITINIDNKTKEEITTEVLFNFQ